MSIPSLLRFYEFRLRQSPGDLSISEGVVLNNTTPSEIVDPRELSREPKFTKPKQARYKALFLDRDGIINRVVMRDGKVASPRTVDELEIFEDAIELVKNVRKLGFLTVLVTNQPDVGRGLMSQADLDEIHRRIGEVIFLDLIEVCTSTNDTCRRRKPNPGMLFDSAKILGIDLKKSWILGDSLKDLEAGKGAGVQTALLETEYNQKIHGRGDINLRTHNQFLQLGNL